MPWASRSALYDIQSRPFRAYQRVPARASVERPSLSPPRSRAHHEHVEGRMGKRNIVVIGASAGGVRALVELFSALPDDFRGSVFVALHVARSRPSLLPEIIGRVASLRAIHPTDREPIQEGVIYVSPPDRHLLVELGSVRVVHGPKENFFRPSINALFRSAAVAYGPHVVGVILTGALSDGAVGLLSVRDRGGFTVVQDPEHAAVSQMPREALRRTVTGLIAWRLLEPNASSRWRDDLTFGDSRIGNLWRLGRRQRSPLRSGRRESGTPRTCIRVPRRAWRPRRVRRSRWSIFDSAVPRGIRLASLNRRRRSRRVRFDARSVPPRRGRCDESFETTASRSRCS
jgi:hypothetical protein